MYVAKSETTSRIQKLVKFFRTSLLALNDPDKLLFYVQNIMP